MYTISIDHFSATIEFFVTKKVKIYFIFAKFSKFDKMNSSLNTLCVQGRIQYKFISVA